MHPSKRSSLSPDEMATAADRVSSAATGSYADLREDGPGAPTPSNENENNQDVGPELNPIANLCKLLTDGDVSADSNGKNPLNKWGRGQILSAFRKYREAHPDDEEAAAIGGDQVMAPEAKESPISADVIMQIAKFVVDRCRIYADFTQLLNKDSSLQEVASQGSWAIVQYIRSRVNDAVAAAQ